MASALTFKTFYERAYHCHFYTETDTYIKSTRLLFERVLRKYSLNTTNSLSELYVKEFNSKTYTGKLNYVYIEDRTLFKTYSSTCFSNILTLFESNIITNIMDSYEYNFLIKGFIHGIIESKHMNLHLSFTNLIDTEKVLDLAAFNSYIYNKV